MQTFNKEKRQTFVQILDVEQDCVSAIQLFFL